MNKSNAKDLMNITFDLINHAKTSPHKIALILENRSINYGELDNLVWMAATNLLDKGVRAGNIVGILQNNELLRRLCTLALIRLGATVVPLARSLTPHQKSEILSSIHITQILSDFLPMSYRKPIVIPVNLSEVINQQDIQHKLLSEEPSSPCLLIPGSGSTGKQKIIPQSHTIIRARTAVTFFEKSYGDDQKILSLTNLEFSSGINRLLSVIRLGGAYAVLDRQPSSISNYCIEKEITTLFCSVFHAEMMLKKISHSSGPIFNGLHSLRISGSMVSLNLRNRVRSILNPNLHLVYGANECGRISAAIPPGVFLDEFTVGSPLPGVKVEVVNSSGIALPYGQRGQIRVRTPSVISSYFNNQEASEKSFKDGWFYTGDIGEQIPSGSLRLFGRSDNMMIMNGINIYPTEIEQTIKEIPGVRDVVVIPMKHKIHQDIPIAAVSLDVKFQLNPEEILKFVTTRLGFRSPRKILVIPEIPRNSNGKLQKNELIKILKTELLES